MEAYGSTVDAEAEGIRKRVSKYRANIRAHSPAVFDQNAGPFLYSFDKIYYFDNCLTAFLFNFVAVRQIVSWHLL